MGAVTLTWADILIIVALIIVFSSAFGWFGGRFGGPRV